MSKGHRDIVIKVNLSDWCRRFILIVCAKGCEDRISLWTFIIEIFDSFKLILFYNIVIKNDFLFDTKK